MNPMTQYMGPPRTSLGVNISNPGLPIAQSANVPVDNAYFSQQGMDSPLEYVPSLRRHANNDFPKNLILSGFLAGMMGFAAGSVGAAIHNRESINKFGGMTREQAKEVATKLVNEELMPQWEQDGWIVDKTPLAGLKELKEIHDSSPQEFIKKVIEANPSLKQALHKDRIGENVPYSADPVPSSRGDMVKRLDIHVQDQKITVIFKHAAIEDGTDHILSKFVHKPYLEIGKWGLIIGIAATLLGMAGASVIHLIKSRNNN